MLHEIKWGGELGQKGIWVPRHDLTPVCILDWSIILKQWVMRQSGGSTHSLCKAIKCCHAQLLKGMGSVKCILLSTGLKIGSCEGREELQPGVRRLLREPPPAARDTQQAAMPCRLLCGKLPGPCSAHWERTPCWMSEPCRKEGRCCCSQKGLITLPFPVTESLTQKRHRFKLKTHPNCDLRRKVSGNYEGFGSYTLMLKSELLGQQAQKIGISSITVLKWPLKENQAYGNGLLTVRYFIGSAEHAEFAALLSRSPGFESSLSCFLRCDRGQVTYSFSDFQFPHR